MEAPSDHPVDTLLAFIQKQIDQILRGAKPGKPLQVKKPHSRFELMMDQIFLDVIRRKPSLAPAIFTSLARYLNGDEFACFLSGEASMKIWLKVIFAMPNGHFYSLCYHKSGKNIERTKSPQTKIWGKTNDRAIHYP